MSRTQQAVSAIATAVVMVAIITWGAWSWLGDSQPSAAKYSDAPPPAAKPSGGSGAPLVIRHEGESTEQTTVALVPASQPATFIAKFPPVLPLAPNEVVCLAMDSLTICPFKEKVYKPDISPRKGGEHYGLVKFDLSQLKEPPAKAVFKGCVFYIENYNGYHTPLRLEFYRMTSEWDDSATGRYASARDEVPWKAGDAFNLRSYADADAALVGTCLVPNPPPDGFNVEVDVTETVAGWVRGDYPNHGLVVTAVGGRELSTQGNLATRRDSRSYGVRIVCTVAKRP